MRVLLDANVVLALAADPARLRPGVVRQLSDHGTTLIVSIVSPWEIAIKWKLGKLPLPDPPRIWTAWFLRETGAIVLPIAVEHAVRVADLPLHHGDPFDRLLIAQAQVEGIPIVTTDAGSARYDVDVITAR